MRKTSRRLESRPAFITGEKEKEILIYFKSTKDNRMTVVAEHFGVSAYQVSRIVDVDIDKKRMKLYEPHSPTK